MKRPPPLYGTENHYVLGPTQILIKQKWDERWHLWEKKDGEWNYKRISRQKVYGLMLSMKAF